MNFYHQRASMTTKERLGKKLKDARGLDPNPINLSNQFPTQKGNPMTSRLVLVT